MVFASYTCNLVVHILCYLRTRLIRGSRSRDIANQQRYTNCIPNTFRGCRVCAFYNVHETIWLSVSTMICAEGIGIGLVVGILITAVVALIMLVILVTFIKYKICEL